MYKNETKCLARPQISFVFLKKHLEFGLTLTLTVRQILGHMKFSLNGIVNKYQGSIGLNMYMYKYNPIKF